MTAHIAEVELDDGLDDLRFDGRHTQALVLVRLRRRPVGAVRVPVRDGVVRSEELLAALTEDEGTRRRIGRELVRRHLGPSGEPQPSTAPSWSVVVCTRDRPEHLRRCLGALRRVDAEGGEILVVDNAPSDDASRRIVDELGVGYVLEPEPGLNRARRRGLDAASGEIVLFTDDDVVVDPGWVTAMLEPFAAHRVGGTAGLVLPLELETRTQEVFERVAPFPRGFERRVFDHTTTPPAAAGTVGAGASMAFRRSLATDLELFDAPLDVGTASLSGGDTYAFYLLLDAGYQIVYTPEALAWHRHRRDMDAVRATLHAYSTGVFSVLARCVVEHRDLEALRSGLVWLMGHHLRELARSGMRRRGRLPGRLVLAELRGCVEGLRVYRRERDEERQRGR